MDAEKVAEELACQFKKRHPGLWVVSSSGSVLVGQPFDGGLQLDFNLEVLMQGSPQDPQHTNIQRAARIWLPFLVMAWVQRCQSEGELAFAPQCKFCTLPLRRSLKRRDEEVHPECAEHYKAARLVGWVGHRLNYSKVARAVFHAEPLPDPAPVVYDREFGTPSAECIKEYTRG